MNEYRHPAEVEKRWRSRRPAAVSGVLLALLLASRVASGDSGDSFLRVSFVDVGQGDAIWIQGPVAADGSPGKNIIIDGGPDRGARNRLPAYLSAYGLAPGAPIDCVVVTHPHDDHYPGLTDVFKGYEVRSIIHSGFPEEGPKWRAFFDLVTAERAGGHPSRVISLRDAPETALEWGDIQASILYADQADADDMGSGSSRTNNASPVIRIVYGAFSFLFMGDAEGKERNGNPGEARYVERHLLDHVGADALRSTVLKVGHHGSETASSLPFIRAVSPKVIVVPSGRKAFGGRFLPYASLLERYRQTLSDLTVLRTNEMDEEEELDTTDDADGDDIYIYTDGDTLLAYRSEPTTHGRRQWVRAAVLQAQ